MSGNKSKPSLFIGSSSEGLEVARAVEWNLHKDAEVTIWSDGVFGLNKGNLEALLLALEQYDFAVLVLTPDDMVTSRELTEQSPRDNIMFELGLFMGRLGRDRTFALCCDSNDMKLPSDLAGVTLAKFNSNRDDRNLRSATSPACFSIRDEIKKFGVNDSSLNENHELKNLKEILGAIGWDIKRESNIDTYDALKRIRTSFDFMGFGFSKYLKIKNESGTISDISQLSETILWKKLETILIDDSQKTIRILMMDPLAYEIEKYTTVLKHKYKESDIEDDLHFSLVCLNEMRRTFGKHIQVKFYPNQDSYKPSFRLFFANGEELFASFYRWGTKGLDLPYIHLEKNDKTFYLPFQILFDYLWKHGVDADIENMPLKIKINDIYSDRSNLANRIKRHIKFQLPDILNSKPFHELKIAAVPVAGRDSALAILQIAKSGEFDCLLPILVGTPGKYMKSTNAQYIHNNLGEFSVRCETIREIRNVMNLKENSNGCYLLNLLFVEPDTYSWSSVFNRIKDDWKFDTSNLNLNNALSSHCIPCHLYIYYIRAKICQLLGIKHMVGGDRVRHDNLVKVNQLETVIDCISQFTQEDFKVEFLAPLKCTIKNNEIKNELDRFGISNIHDVSCIFDGQGSLTFENGDNSIGDEVVNQLKLKINTIILPSLESVFYEIHGCNYK